MGQTLSPSVGRPGWRTELPVKPIEAPTKEAIRMRITIRSMMVAVVVVACVLSMPGHGQFVAIVAMVSSILAILILCPAWLAPPGRRVEAAFWAPALHPLLILGWLLALRPPGHCPPLYQYDERPILSWLFLLAWLSRYYMPVGWVVGAFWFPRRSVFKPLVALPVAWLTTMVVLAWDPFELQPWVWD